ncbi:hypothetical protein DTO013E5_10131 [Penicillium roqueforti]|nr:hypothetical protein DTO012A1_8747 [Penicillium roqueforti]KAI2738916.1 hypothetical protein DTO013F2_9470 [Penicillium roqueforti]KAI2749651.1 hypothetical protein DTO006G1_9950 [Penicillium roqueforti]KAI2750399.1 hypothetical protein DTO012A8_9832 [Penicillium roqueforti]KAI3196064.1 hypothetical protein DTO013E5_10131 [Penicillium roqueforti]
MESCGCCRSGIYAAPSNNCLLTPANPIIASSLQQTPWLHKTSSFANSSEYRQDVARVLNSELGPLHIWGVQKQFGERDPGALIRLLEQVVDTQQIEAANAKLGTGNIQLCNEGNHLKHRQDEQVARLHAIDDALDEVRGKLIGVLKVWNERSVGELAILPEDEFPRR